MTQQNVPLLFRVVLLHAAVFGTLLAIMQVNTALIAAQTSPITIAAPAPTVPKEQVKVAVPVQIQIPSVNITVDVTPGRYDSVAKVWDLSTTSAQYITTSTPNFTMIYGHNTANIFELTNSLKVGDELIVTSSDKTVTKYRFTSDYLTTPTDTSMLSAQYNKPTVALMTCNGFWSQDRRFMFFEPIEEVK